MKHPMTPHLMIAFTQQPIIFLFPLLLLSIDIPLIHHTPPDSNQPRISADPVFSFALVSSWFQLFQCLVSVLFSSMAPEQLTSKKNKFVTECRNVSVSFFFCSAM